MKAVLSVVIILLTINFSSAQRPRRTPKSTNYHISVTPEQNKYVLGQPILITVEYYNGSDSVWQLYRPDSSVYCSISYRNFLWRTESIWNGGAFNVNRFVNLYEDKDYCPECGYVVAVVGDNIRLKPQERYSFKTDLMEGYKDYTYVLPGNYTARFNDAFEAIRSDTVEFCLIFTRTSVNYLLERLVSEKESKSNIEWVINILTQIYPDIKNYQLTRKENEIVYSAGQLKNNKELLKEFKEYWKLNKETEEIKDKIHAINTDFRKYSFMDMRRIKLLKKTCIKYETP